MLIINYFLVYSFSYAFNLIGAGYFGLFSIEIDLNSSFGTGNYFKLSTHRRFPTFYHSIAFLWHFQQTSYIEINKINNKFFIFVNEARWIYGKRESTPPTTIGITMIR